MLSDLCLAKNSFQPWPKVLMSCVLLLAANQDVTVFSEARPGGFQTVRKIRCISSLNCFDSICEDSSMTHCGNYIMVCSIQLGLQVWTYKVYKCHKSHSNSLMARCEAYGFIEIFSGAGWVTKCMQANGIASCKFDINLSQPVEGKQDAMNILTDPGFAFFGFHTTNNLVMCASIFRGHLYMSIGVLHQRKTFGLWGPVRLILLAILNARFDDFVFLAGLVCSSYVTVSMGTHYRAPWFPLGREDITFVDHGNRMTSRRVASKNTCSNRASYHPHWPCNGIQQSNIKYIGFVKLLGWVYNQITSNHNHVDFRRLSQIKPGSCPNTWFQHLIQSTAIVLFTNKWCIDVPNVFPLLFVAVVDESIIWWSASFSIIKDCTMIVHHQVGLGKNVFLEKRAWVGIRTIYHVFQRWSTKLLAHCFV